MEKKKEEKPAYKKDYLYMAYRGKEYLWLAFAAISIIMTISELVTRKEGETNEGAWYFLGLTFLSGLFYSFNRYRRIKFEKRAQEAEKK